MKRIGYGLLFVLAWASHVEAQVPFYQGKSLKIVVGYPSGSSHDQWARLVAPYLSKYLPGRPNTIVQNMPGAGSTIAANYIYGIAKSDGLTLGIINGGLYLDQLLARREIKFDWSGFSWVGSSTPADLLLYMWANTPYKTIHDVRNAEVVPKCGATGAATGGNYIRTCLPR